MTTVQKSVRSLAIRPREPAQSPELAEVVREWTERTPKSETVPVQRVPEQDGQDRIRFDYD